MNVHEIVMEITRREQGAKQVNIAQATAVIHSFAHMLKDMGLVKALWTTFTLRRSIKK